MVAKKNNRSDKEETGSRIKVGKLQLNKETVKDLTGGEKKGIKGGARNVRTVDNCQYSKCTNQNCVSQLYPGGPCGINSQLDCV